MFSVITNIYNNKSKGPTLMELFTATGKLIFFLFSLSLSLSPPTRDVRCVHHGWHGAHRYDIQVLATHATTRSHRYSSLLRWSVPLGQRGHVGKSFAYFARNARCTATTDLLVWYANTQNDFSPRAAIFLLHPSYRLAAEMWTTIKNNLLGKTFLSCSFYLYRFHKCVSYGFLIVSVCNPGVHFETPCITSDEFRRISISLIYTIHIL
jgi:hypothetical protein